MMLGAIVLALSCVTVQATWYESDPQCPGLADHTQPRREPGNIKFAAQLAKEMREADAGKGYELIFYGDSITEQWRGTDQSGICDRCHGDRQLFEKYFGKYRAGVFAVGGDQVAHLQWRLLHGEIPVKHHPKIAVVMIGTNDLGAVASCSRSNETEITDAFRGVTNRLAFMLELLQDRLPYTDILLLGLTPRGDGFGSESRWVWPGIFTPAIEDVNAWLRLQADIRPKVHYLDCGPALLRHGQLTPELFADGLHPSYAGMDLMGKCISEVVDDLIGERRVLYTRQLPRAFSINLQITGYLN